MSADDGKGPTTLIRYPDGTYREICGAMSGPEAYLVKGPDAKSEWRSGDDKLAAYGAELTKERDALRAECDALAAEVEKLRAERDKAWASREKTADERDEATRLALSNAVRTSKAEARADALAARVAELERGQDGKD